jgi:plastocyanin
MTASLPLRAAALMPIAVGVAICSAATASAVVPPPPQIVSVDPTSYSPATVTQDLDGTIDWVFVASNSVTDSSTMDLFNSGVKSSGRYEFSFTQAGTFAYHSSSQPSVKGTVIWNVIRSRNDGAPGTYTVTWASAIRTGYVEDVEIMRPGATTYSWLAFGTSAKSSTLDLSKAGRYWFRARMRKKANNGVSGFSPAVSIAIS